MSERFGIIGSGSMIALQTIETWEQRGDITLTKADKRSDNYIDITDRKSVDNFFQAHGANFDWAILFAAITDVKVAEAERNNKDGIAWRVNVDGAQNVAEACKKYGKDLIFFSTDFVFDGTNGPYTEQDPTGPDLEKVTWYGITKIEGEKKIIQILPQENFLILRISYPFSGLDFGKEDLALKTINYLDEKGELYPMYDDQNITPTYIPDIASAIIFLISKGTRGIIHLASPKITDQYEFASVLLKHYFGRPIEVKRGKLKDELKRKGEPKPVPRPLDGGLSVDKIIRIGFRPTSWDEGIAKIPPKAKQE